MDEDIYLKGIRKLAKKYKKWILVGSLIIKVSKNKLVNRSVLIDKNGKIRCYYDKIHMYDVILSKKERYFESKSFTAGNRIKSFKLPWGKLGLSICYDLRFPNLFRKLAKRGAEIILMPAAFTIPSGKAHWEILLRSRAIENSLFVIATNMCGTHHSNRKTYGHSMLVNPWGEIIAKAKSTPKIMNTKINLAEVLDARKKIPAILND